MNYLIRESELMKAISDKYKNGSREEKNAEFDRLQEMLREMIDAYHGEIKNNLQMILAKSGEKQDDNTDLICRKMMEINGMCFQYGVEPVFPEAGSNAEHNEIREAISLYMDQMHKRDRLTRSLFDKAVKTKNYDEYFKKFDELTEHIEDFMTKDDDGDVSD